MKTLTKSAFGFTALLALSSASHAATITTLFNTGVDSAGAVLADDVADSHYVFVAGVGAVITSGNPLAIANTEFPIFGGPWLAATASSSWIGTLATNGQAPVDQGSGLLNLYYETSFDMSGLDPATAAISFDLNADNEMTEFYINGTLITSITKTTSFGVVESITLNPAQIALINGGVNTFKFKVASLAAAIDTSDYFGLNVNFTTRTADAIPEPSALGLLGLGGLAAIGLRRRRA